MRDLILSNSEGIEIYIIYFLVLILVNTSAKIIFDSGEITSSTKKIISIFSAVTFLLFWLFGSKLIPLFFTTFFTFGFYDFIGRYVEKLVTIILMRISLFFNKIYKKVTSKIRIFK